MNNKFQISNFKFQISKFKIFFLFPFFLFPSLWAYAEEAQSSNYQIKFISPGATISYPNSPYYYFFSPFVIGEQIAVPLEISSTDKIIIFDYWLPPSGEVIYEIVQLKAKTSLGGLEIMPSTWQKDNDPYFYWLILITPPTLINGFSFSLDSLPDKEVDTEFTSYQYPDESISDGKHSFFVAPYVGGDTWGKPLSFEIWVDTTAPVVNEIIPSSGTLIAQKEVEVSCRIKDTASGLDLESLKLALNGKNVRGEFDEEEGVYSYKASLEDGENTVLIEAKDNVGNQTTKSWSFIVDSSPPEGSILINNGDPVTNSAYVTLKISASDEISGIKYMYISNDGVFDTELKKPLKFVSQVNDWLLREPDISGKKTVYVKFQDYAGNLSESFSDAIDLVVTVPDTRIISAPFSLTSQQQATFYYQASREGSLFSYSLDGQDWSSWSALNNVSFSSLNFGSHLFKVKAGFDINGNNQIDKDEEDPTPAQWSWTIRKETFIEKLERILFFKRK